MLRDTYHRPLKDLHISVTAQYNLRCTYGIPLAEYDWPEKSAILSFEEITPGFDSVAREIPLPTGDDKTGGAR